MTTTKPRTAAKRVIAALGAVLAMTLAIVIPPHAAQAQVDNIYSGRYVTGVGRVINGIGLLLSAVEPPGNGDQTYPAWCIQMWRPNPTAQDTATIATLSEANGWAPSDISLTVPQAAWMLNEYQANPQADSRAAIAYLMHANFEQPDPQSGHPDAQASVDLLVKQVKDQLPEVHSLAANYVAQARKSAVSGYEKGAVEGDGKRTGTVHSIGIVGEDGNYLAGHEVTVKLTGPAIFDDTGTDTWNGKTKSEPITLEWTATGNGDVTVSTKYPKVLRRTLTKYGVDGTIQDTISYGDRPGTGDPESIVQEGPSWRVIYDFQPIVQSNVPDKTVSVGDVLEDVLTVEADPNYGSGEWFKIPGSEDYIPVKFEGTAYLVGDLPVDKPSEVPADATVIGTASFTANGPGEYRAKLDKPASKPGFVTWVWRMVRENQDAAYVEYIHADFSDQYGIAEETTSVWHEAEIDSSLSIRETKSGTYLVDDLWVTGMPDDHPNFTGDGRFAADTKEIMQRLYFFPDGVEVTDDNLAAATLVGEVSLPAKNGFYPSVGSTEFKLIHDEAGQQVPGTYVFVTSFAGDDRVKAMTTSVTDANEQYVITPEPLSVVTKAVPEIIVGETAHDTAIVTGTVPAGATLGFELYKAVGQDKTCTPENRVFTSPAKPLPGPGEYASDDTVLNEAGTYYWVETVRDKNGATLHRGECGLPHETTIVKPKDDDGDKASRLPTTGTIASTAGAIASLSALAGAGAIAARRKLNS